MKGERRHPESSGGVAFPGGRESSGECRSRGDLDCGSASDDFRFPVSGSRRIEVVAAVLRDRRGRILLARRTEGRDLAGLWEFPGGKHEPDETAEDALRRELREELGIEIEPGTPLIRVPQAYPGKRLHLDVYEVPAWRGTVRGLEGQALAWVPPHKLTDYPMPPADIPVVAALLQPDRYLVTPMPGASDEAWLAMLQAVLAKGVRRVQLRAPGCEAERWHALARQAVAACRQAGADVLVNDDIALALELGAGVHLKSVQLRSLAERPLPAGQLVAASCHDAADLRAAQALDCDFAVLGPVEATASHPGEPGMGWEAFARLREGVSVPIYAIGGLTAADIPQARAHGAQGIAAIRALWPHDP